MSKAGWIGVDLDGTLAHYEGWKGIEHIGEPIDKMLDRVKRWIREGREVRIFTARVSEVSGDQDRDGGPEQARVHIELWCQKHIGTVLPVTNVKDFAMDELWDDRCVQVRPNTGIAMCASPRGLDTP
jgi:hypothetical protein